MIILNIGKKGSGKTTRTVKLILPFSKQEFKLIHIFDVNNEYEDLIKKKNVLIYDNFADILEVANSDEKNNLFVFEEATIFFSHSKSQKIVDFLVKQRHKNNDFIFNFHSLRSIPLYILDFTDFLMVGKTNDLEDFVSDKFYGTNIPTTYNKVKKEIDPYYHLITKL